MKSSQTAAERQARSTHRHAFYEDIIGITAGAISAGFGLVIFQSTGLVATGTAGMALLANYLTGTSVGLAFFLVNLPFYVVGFLRLGWKFTLRTFASVMLLALTTDIINANVSFKHMDPIIGGIVAAILVGFGLLAVFRHNSSFGGSGILALYLQDRFGFRAGITLLIVDTAVMLIAILVTTPYMLVVSIGSALLLNLFIAVNHRNDRYLGRSL